MTTLRDRLEDAFVRFFRRKHPSFPTRQDYERLVERLLEGLAEELEKLRTEIETAQDARDKYRKTRRYDKALKQHDEIRAASGDYYGYVRLFNFDLRRFLDLLERCYRNGVDLEEHEQLIKEKLVPFLTERKSSGYFRLETTPLPWLLDKNQTTAYVDDMFKSAAEACRETRLNEQIESLPSAEIGASEQEEPAQTVERWHEFTTWRAIRDFSRVTIKNGESEFKPTQAQIQVLIYLHEKGIDSVHQKQVQKAMGRLESTRLREVFKSRPGLYKTTIEVLPFPKGHVRLKR